jgi:putative endonuclease
MNPTGWVYIMTNKHNTTFYVGMTNTLSTRTWEHRTKRNPKSFTAKYNLTKLVYYEGLETIIETIDREDFIKGKSRQWKVDLIKKMNPNFDDLYDQLHS